MKKFNNVYWKISYMNKIRNMLTLRRSLTLIAPAIKITGRKILKKIIEIIIIWIKIAPGRKEVS
jgi:hypothetical protein